ncbi:interferon-induced protein with tetratricopeptide repeats 5-like [Mixophyes fleayi]|uniref:interferon-induced protein with tetratricopeptide repeats 5-like n=1 Tax=Mixophyes fleayi TaxID=3061075 RepID=UPI003F4DD22D
MTQTKASHQQIEPVCSQSSQSDLPENCPIVLMRQLDAPKQNAKRKMQNAVSLGGCTDFTPRLTATSASVIQQDGTSAFTAPVITKIKQYPWRASLACLREGSAPSPMPLFGSLSSPPVSSLCALSENTLKSHLLQLKCHFTWRLLEKDADTDALEDKLHSQLSFSDTKSKYRVYNLLAYAMHLKGDYTEAIANLEQAEKNIKENNPDGMDRKYLVTFGDYAWVYYYLKQYEDSQNYIDKIDNINTGLKLLSNESQDTAEVYGEQGWSLLTFSGKYCKKAKECFEKALELDPEDPEWNSGYATVVYRLEGLECKMFFASECKSSLLLKRAVELNPNDAVVKALLALKLQDLKKIDEGKKYVEEALEQAPNLPYLLRYVAKFYRRAGMVDEALRVLKTAVDLMPTSPFLHHQIGLCYKQKMILNKKAFDTRDIQNRQKQTGEIDELTKKAIFHFEIALECKKTFVWAYIDLANMYSELKEIKRAEEIFKKVLMLTNVIDEEKQQIHLNYGHFEEFIKKSESEAIKHYKKGFQIAKQNKFRNDCKKALKRLQKRRN